MQSILRTLLALVALLAAGAGLAACGGGDEASSDTSVDTLLDKTFSGSKDVKSGKIDLSLKLNVSGGEGVEGPIDVSLSGPFESQGAAKLPKFAMEFAASGQGQNIKAGATSTGEKGFVSFNGEDYAVSDEVFKQFKDGYEQAAAKGAKDAQGDKTSLASLGLDPKTWLTDPKNAGEGSVGDTDVVRITGGLDVGRFLDDLNGALSRAGELGLQNQQLPTQLTDEQKKEVQKAIKDVKVEIATGEEDTILRRMKIDLDAEDPAGRGGKATLAFDLQLLDLNEGQEFPEPDSPKPFDQLLSQLGGLGGLGALGGAGAGGSAGSGGASGSSGGASSADIEEYSKCLEDAGQDLDKAQQCADILAP